MREYVTIEITLDTDSESIIDFDILDNCGRTEYVAKDIDEPISIKQAVKKIETQLTEYI